MVYSFFLFREVLAAFSPPPPFQLCECCSLPHSSGPTSVGWYGKNTEREWQRKPLFSFEAIIFFIMKIRSLRDILGCYLHTYLCPRGHAHSTCSAYARRRSHALDVLVVCAAGCQHLVLCQTHSSSTQLVIANYSLWMILHTNRKR